MTKSSNHSRTRKHEGQNDALFFLSPSSVNYNPIKTLLLFSSIWLFFFFFFWGCSAGQGSYNCTRALFKIAVLITVILVAALNQTASNWMLIRFWWFCNTCFNSTFGSEMKTHTSIKCSFIKHFCFHWHCYQYRNKIPLKQENAAVLYQLETFTTLKFCMFNHRTWCQEKIYFHIVIFFFIVYNFYVYLLL